MIGGINNYKKVEGKNFSFWELASKFFSQVRHEAERSGAQCGAKRARGSAKSERELGLLLVKFCVALPAGFLKVTQEHRGRLGTHMRPSGRVAVGGLIPETHPGKVGYLARPHVTSTDRSFGHLNDDNIIHIHEW